MGIYQTIYNLLMTAFYAVTDPTLLTGWQELTLTLISTFFIIFLFALPFIVVWKVIQFICGR